MDRHSELKNTTNDQKSFLEYKNPIYKRVIKSKQCHKSSIHRFLKNHNIIPTLQGIHGHDVRVYITGTYPDFYTAKHYQLDSVTQQQKQPMVQFTQISNGSTVD